MACASSPKWAWGGLDCRPLNLVDFVFRFATAGALLAGSLFGQNALSTANANPPDDFSAASRNTRPSLVAVPASIDGIAGSDELTASCLHDLYEQRREIATDYQWPSPFFSAPRQGANDLDSRLHRSDRACETIAFDHAPPDDATETQGKPAAPPVPSKQPTAEQGSPKHIFLVVPAFEVTYDKKFERLTPRQKFDEWARGAYDPAGLGLYAFEAATLENVGNDGYCGYGKGFGNYGECLGSMELDANISSFLGDFLFPTLLHQDPRYFRLGTGSFPVRVWYAVSRVFITHTDAGRWTFASGALAGSVVAAASSNLYYPRNDRGFGPSLDRFAIDLADTAAFNVSAEFWPEIKHGLNRVF